MQLSDVFVKCLSIAVLPVLYTAAQWSMALLCVPSQEGRSLSGGVPAFSGAFLIFLLQSLSIADVVCSPVTACILELSADS